MPRRHHPGATRELASAERQNTSASYDDHAVPLTARLRFDAALVRYDGWFLVFVAVLLALGATLLAGMAIWCLANQHGRFTGHWYWNSGLDVALECSR